MKTILRFLVILLIVEFLSCEAFSQNRADINKQKPNIIICGEIKRGFGEVHFMDSKRFPLRETLHLKTELKDEKFRIEFFINKPHVVGMMVNEINHHYPVTTAVSTLFIEPGDSLYVTGTAKYWEPTVQFSGKGAANNNFSKNYWKFFKNVRDKSDASIRSKFETIENDKRKKLTYLQQSKDSLSHEFYNYMKAEITYGAASFKLNILESNYRKRPDREYEMYLSFTDSMEIVNDKALLSQRYLGFISNYIFLKLKSLKVKINKHTFQKQSEWDDAFSRDVLGEFSSKICSNAIFSRREIYFFAKALLTGETRHVYLGNQIHRDIISIDNATDTFLINDFLETYPDKTLSQQIRNEHLAIQQTSSGSIAPVFKLKNINDKQVSLNEFKGKIVCLVFWNSHYGSEYQKMLLTSQLAKQFNDDAFVVLYVDVNEDQTEWKQVVKKRNYKGIHLSNPGWSGQNTAIYRKFFYNYIYLIDNEGKFTSYIHHDYIPPHHIDKLLKKNAENKINKSNILKIFILVITNLLVGGLLIWLIVKVRSNQIMKREKAKRKFTELELKSLRSRMNPHFLFNSLSSIQNLINKNEIKSANLYLAKFAGLMRKILVNSESMFISISDEIGAVGTYLELEKLRFDFDYTIDIEPEVDIHNIEIPGLLIQPFVENAIIHGISETEKRGKLQISVKQKKKDIVFGIEDNGIGYKNDKIVKKKSKKKGTGLGIRLTNERLEILNLEYPGNYNLKINSIVDRQDEINGTKVEIIIPVED
jgi:hypothetical protein